MCVRVCVCVCFCVRIYKHVYVLHKFFVLRLQEGNFFSRNSAYDRQGVYFLCAEILETRDLSPLYRVKAGPGDP